MSDYQVQPVQPPAPVYQQPAYAQPAAQPVDANYIAYLEQRVRALEAKTAVGFLNGGFMKRAFSIWGYSFVANFIIGLIVSVIMTIISLIFGAALFATLGSALQNAN